MATRAPSGFCILFLILSASHVLPSTEAARILDENKAAGDGSTRYNPLNPNPLNPDKPLPHGGSGVPYTRPCNKKMYGCPP